MSRLQNENTEWRLSPAVLHKILRTFHCKPEIDLFASRLNYQILKYPNLNKSLKKKLQRLQNKYIRFCLNLNNRDHIGLTDFEKISWLPINDRFEQCISSITFLNFLITRVLRIWMIFLHLLFISIPTLSYMAPYIWNSLPVSLKATEDVNTYKHTIKNHFLDRMKNNESNKYSYF